MTSHKFATAAAALMIATASLAPASAQMSGESPNPSEAVGDSNITEQLMRYRVRMEVMADENAQLKRLVAQLLSENERLKAGQ
jgi:hypothetical protein